MKKQNDAVAEIGFHQKSFGENVLDVAACKILDTNIGSIRKDNIMDLIIFHEIWLTNDGEFARIDKILEGNNEKAYEFHVFMGNVYECYNLNLSSDELMEKIKNFAENGID